MTFISVRCPYCHSDQIIKCGKTRRGTQRYLCQNTACPPQSFLLEYSYRGRLPEVKQQIVDMSLNASSVRDTARVLRISTDTVLRALRKKEAALESVHTALLRSVDPDKMLVDIQQAGEAEIDEMWSFVGNQGSPRWLWHAIDHHTGAVLAYVFGRRKEICQSDYDSRKRLYLVAACGNHQCIGFVKARTVVSMSARRSFRRYRMYKPDNSPPACVPQRRPRSEPSRDAAPSALGDAPSGDASASEPDHGTCHRPAQSASHAGGGR